MKSGGLSLPGAREAKMLGRHWISFMIRRFLILAVLASLVFFVIASFETVETSYLDLIDSLMPDSPSLQSSGQGDSRTSMELELNPCDDELGWIEEYISTGLMPRCSLVHNNKIGILYT